MSTQHPITPTPELVTSLLSSVPQGVVDAFTRELWLINRAYSAGADQELEACCHEVQTLYSGGSRLRAARRPKPLSVKEQALEAASRLSKKYPSYEGADIDTIRRALEALPND
jgi:hypothetical protein